MAGQIQGLAITSQGFGLSQTEPDTTFESIHFDGIKGLASSSISAVGLPQAWMAFSNGAGF